jgi:hypothetical protein
MRLADLSTSLPTLARGEPGCPDLNRLTVGTRRALLSAAGGSLRRGGMGWFGPDKTERFPRVTVQALINRGLLFMAHHHVARLNKRGLWCARTLCTEIAGLSYCVEINGVSNFIMGRNGV